MGHDINVNFKVISQHQQYEYSILIITQVRGKANGTGDNLYWGMTVLYPNEISSSICVIIDQSTPLYSIQIMCL